MPEHNTNRMAAVLDFLEQYECDGEEMLYRIVMGDETWVQHFTPQHKKAVDGLKRTQRTITKKIQNCFVGKQSDKHGFLGCKRGHMAGIPS